MFCAKFGWNWPSVTGEEEKMWGVYDKNDEDGATDNVQIHVVIIQAHLSLRIRRVKKHNGNYVGILLKSLKGAGLSWPFLDNINQWLFFCQLFNTRMYKSTIYM